MGPSPFQKQEVLCRKEIKRLGNEAKAFNSLLSLGYRRVHSIPKAEFFDQSKGFQTFSLWQCFMKTRVLSVLLNKSSSKSHAC